MIFFLTGYKDIVDRKIIVSDTLTDDFAVSISPIAEEIPVMQEKKSKETSDCVTKSPVASEIPYVQKRKSEKTLNYLPAKKRTKYEKRPPNRIRYDQIGHTPDVDK